jgi:hypothetical protein
VNEQDIEQMADIMVRARRNGEDVGELVAAALQDAAEKLGGAERLVTGRPGSWEADIVLRMAQDTWFDVNQKRLKALSVLFVKMGEANANGGDILSQAMSKAVDELGGLKEFAGMSRWYWDLVNIGCQYSQHEYSEAMDDKP